MMNRQKVLLKIYNKAIKNNKNALMKRFHNDRQIQVYMYAFICVKPETIPEEDNFPDTRTFVEKYKKRSTPGPVPKH